MKGWSSSRWISCNASSARVSRPEVCSCSWPAFTCSRQSFLYDKGRSASGTLSRLWAEVADEGTAVREREADLKVATRRHDLTLA